MADVWGAKKNTWGSKMHPNWKMQVYCISIFLYIYKYAYIYIYICVINIYICIDSIFPFVKIIIVQASKPFIPSRRSRGAVYSGQIHQNLLPSDG